MSTTHPANGGPSNPHLTFTEAVTRAVAGTEHHEAVATAIAGMPHDATRASRFVAAVIKEGFAHAASAIEPESPTAAVAIRGALAAFGGDIADTGAIRFDLWTAYQTHEQGDAKLLLGGAYEVLACAASSEWYSVFGYLGSMLPAKPLAEILVKASTAAY